MGVGMASKSTCDRHKTIDLVRSGGKRGDEAHERCIARQRNAVGESIGGPRIIARAGRLEPRVDLRRQRHEHLVRLDRPHRLDTGRSEACILRMVKDVIIQEIILVRQSCCPPRHWNPTVSGRLERDRPTLV